MNRDTLDRLNFSRDRVRHMGYDLRGLADSFRDVGNLIVADRLDAFSAGLDDVAAEIDGATSDAVMQAFNASVEASDNMFRAAFAVAEVLDNKKGVQS